MVALQVLYLDSSVDKRKNHGLNNSAGKKHLDIGRLLCNGKKVFCFLSQYKITENPADNPQFVATPQYFISTLIVKRIGCYLSHC
jgi:hypothetical protein